MVLQGQQKTVKYKIREKLFYILFDLNMIFFLDMNIEK